MRRVTGLLGLLLAVACLASTSAPAAETRLPVESFGPDGTSGSSFAYPGALTFDQGNERLYALDQGPASIYGFDASSPGTHTPLGGSFPLAAPGSEPGWLDDLVADSASHDLYFLSEAKAFSAEPSLYGFEASGTPLAGNFPIGGFGDPCGAGVDPSGNVWVGDYATEAVNEYDSAGNPIDSIGTAAQGHPCHLAFDSESNLYASMYEGGTWRYSAASGYASATEIDPIAGAFPTPSAALAVDQADRLYVAHSSRVAVYDDTGAPLYEFGGTVAGAEYAGISIDRATDRVYLSDLAHMTIQVFGTPVPLASVRTEDATAITASLATLNGTVDPNGKALTACSFEYGTTAAYGESAPCVPAAASIPADSNPHAVSADISGLAPNTTYHVRLVAETAEGTSNGNDHVFTTAIGAPTVSSQGVESVGTADAILNAKVNPKGAATTYHVEYGTTASYGQSSAESAPIGSAGDDSNHNASVHIGGLQPGTTYHFRFVANSPVGSGAGTDTTFATYPPTSPPSSCSNDAFRTGFGANLPDCRAYEQATPIDKHGANIQGGIAYSQASSAGDGITFLLTGGLTSSGGSSTLPPFMASRGATGWSSDGLLPATDPGQGALVSGWSEDLALSVSTAPGPGNVGAAVYLRDSASGAFSVGPTGPTALRETFLAGFAADTSHLLFETGAPLVPGVATGKYNLYELDHGDVSLAGRIPAGAAASCDDAAGPACVPAPEGSVAGPYKWQAGNTNSGGAESFYYTQNTISRDGSRVFFTATGSGPLAGQLYVREDGARTTRVSASQRAVPDPNGPKPAAWLASSADGSEVFFMSCEKLTDDSTAVSTAVGGCTSGPVGQDLYAYDVDTGELSDLTVDSNGDPRGAAVQGVLGSSEDGSHVYFVANGVLAPGASLGSCGGGGGSTCNLYVWHEGTTSFVTTLSGGGQDPLNWLAGPASLGVSQRTSRVSADGRTALFASQRSLTGYANGGKVEFYRYSAPAEELLCVSCNPTGLPASEDATLATSTVAFNISLRLSFFTRNLSSDGNRAFFQTPDALLPADTNGVRDVYEWEAEGSGSCKSAVQNDGCLYLLSSGTSPSPSQFLDASASGDHVFFLTSQQLVPSDRDRLIDVYDAGVGGGLAAQHALAPATCTAVACQANPPPPPEQGMASATFSGPGNAHPRSKARKCPKGKRRVRSAGKTRCLKASKKQHKRHTDRGGSK